MPCAFLWKVAVLLAALLAWGGAGALAAPAPDADALSAAVRRAVEVPDLVGAEWGFVLADARTGQALYDRNGTLLFTPASVQKLYTAAAALSVLGPDFRYVTRLLRRGPVRDGRLEGALVLVGSGDPSLATGDLRGLARAVSAAGIHEATDGLIVDDFQMSDVRLGPGWAWDDESSDYSAQLGALSVNENTVDVTVTPALVPGLPPFLDSDPPRILHFQNLARTGAAADSDSLSVVRQRARNDVEVLGVVPAGQPDETRVTVENPPMYTGGVFRWLLEQAGVTMGASLVRAGTPPGTSPLATHRSAPLRELVRHMLKTSDNFYAEQVVRTVRLPGPDAAEGPAAVRRTLAGMGLDAARYKLVDGSGLSRYNLLRPDDVVHLLRAMQEVDAFRDALPVAGVDGTMRHRLAHTALQGRILAKTGSMSGVSSLAGYVLDEQGRPAWTFTFMVNHFLCPSHRVKQVEDALLQGVAEVLTARSPASPPHPTR